MTPKDYSEAAFWQSWAAIKDTRDIRVGQHFCNFYNFTYPELFYETDHQKAKELIKKQFGHGKE